MIYPYLSIFILHSLAMAEDLPDASFAEQQATLWWDCGMAWLGWVKMGIQQFRKCHFYSGICSLRQYICYWLNCTRWPFKTFENILKQIRICSLRDRRNVVPKEQDLHAMTLKQNRTFYYLCKILAPSPQCQPRTVTGACHGWNFHGTQPFVEGCCL